MATVLQCSCRLTAGPQTIFYETRFLRALSLYITRHHYRDLEVRSFRLSLMQKDQD